MLRAADFRSGDYGNDGFGYIVRQWRFLLFDQLFSRHPGNFVVKQ
jgi:hypothetical protein